MVPVQVIPPHATLHCGSPSMMGDSTNAATVDVSRARKKHLSSNVEDKPLNSCFLLPSRSQRRPTPPPSATLQPMPVLDSAAVLFHNSCRTACRFTILSSLVLVKVRVASLSLWRLFSSTASWPCTWMADVDFLVHLHRACSASSPISLTPL